jgi:hypothetical protein
MKISKKFGSERSLVMWGTILVLMVPSVSALVLIGLGMFVYDVETLDLAKPEDAPPIVTLAEFDQIEKSMSYQEVVDIIGDPGFVTAPSAVLESDAGVVETRIYVWQNSDSSNMNATFQNDQLFTKAQLYLK